MECLRNYIGIYGVDSSPESGLFVNNLPGVSLQSIDKLAKPEQTTYKRVWDDLQTRVIKKFEGVVTTYLNQRFRKKSIRQSLNLGKKTDTVTTSLQTAAEDQFRGYSVECNLQNTEPFTISALQGVSWQSLSLYLKAVPASEFVVKIVDMDTKEILWTKTLNNVANPVTTGWNNITVNEIFYSAYRLFACYDGAEIEAPFLEIDHSLSSSLCGCISSAWGCDCDAYIRGAKSTTKTDPDNLSYSENSYGLTGVFSIICTYQPLVCDNKRLFDSALLYMLGEELCIERMYSDRWNFWTLNLDEARDMQRYFKKTWDEHMQLAINGIDLDLNDGCIECNNQVTVQTISA